MAVAGHSSAKNRRSTCSICSADSAWPVSKCSSTACEVSNSVNDQIQLKEVWQQEVCRSSNHRLSLRNWCRSNDGPVEPPALAGNNACPISAGVLPEHLNRHCRGGPPFVFGIGYPSVRRFRIGVELFVSASYLGFKPGGNRWESRLGTRHSSIIISLAWRTCSPGFVVDGENDANPNYQGRIRKAQAEINQLETVDIPRVTKLVAEARAEGDLRENAEYHGQRENLAMLEAKLSQLKTKLLDCYIVEKTDSNGVVVFGSKVTLRDLDANEDETYELVGRARKITRARS